MQQTNTKAAVITSYSIHYTKLYDIDTPTDGNRIVVFGVKNAIETIDDLKNLIVAQYQGSPIYLRNIADIEYGFDIQNFQDVLIARRDGITAFNPTEAKRQP